MLLKCGGWHRWAKISKTKLPLPHIFCPLNNTFQNIPFQHLQWAKHSLQRALSGATQAQLSLTSGMVLGTETGCSSWRKSSADLLHLSWQERLSSLTKPLISRAIALRPCTLLLSLNPSCHRKDGKRPEERDFRDEEGSQPPAFLFCFWCYSWLCASATSS